MVTPARQVQQQQTPQQNSQAAYSTESPWRATQGPPLDLPLRRQTPSTAKPLKLPNLPRLGAQNQQNSQQLPPLGQYIHQHNQPQQPQQPPPAQQPSQQQQQQQQQKFLSQRGQQLQQPQQQQQPTFAQIVQQAQQAQQQQQAPPLSPGLAKGHASPRLPKLNGVPLSPASNGGHAGDSAANILGSVNSQMMPKLNASSGMSGLNTVLPGIANQNQATSSRGAKQAVPNTAMLQNLNLGSDWSGSGQGPATAQRPQSDSEKYGLKSLLGVMDMRDKERQNVVLGTDLGLTGLNLGHSDEKLSRTFASPWQETSTHALVPDFQLPACYNIPTVVPQQQKLQNFDEGALFYIFYMMPRDAMQEAAAVELTNRSWRYHKELKMWLTKDPLSEPIQTNNQEESGIYIFFDPTTWKKVKRDYVLYYQDIA